MDLECLIEKIDGCKNIPQNSLTTKVGEHIPSDFSISTVSSFKSIENKHDVYIGKDCTNRFCEFLRGCTMKITNFKKEKKKLLTKEEEENIKLQKSAIFVKKNLKINMWKINNFLKLEIIVIIQGDIEVLCIANVI